MFSSLRTDADVRLVVALGEGPHGTVALPTEATGHRHLTQAVRALSDAVNEGGDRPALLCWRTWRPACPSCGTAGCRG
jgi:hypothetical protein